MTKKQFYQYLYDFYGKSGVYPMNATFKMIKESTQKHINALNCLDKEFCADSIDRELIRDIMIKDFSLKFPV
jgi:hypothetical protein